MDREKVFDAFRNCITEPKCKDCPWETCEEFHQTKKIPLDLCLDILELLKEQEAVEPKKESDGNPEMWASWWYVCGNCGEGIDWHDRYCWHCGRAVKWN